MSWARLRTVYWPTFKVLAVTAGLLVRAALEDWIHL